MFFYASIGKRMENIMTKEEKIERFKKMNENIIPGQIVCAGSSLMEMFPVEELAKEYRNKRPQQSGYTNRRNDRKL